MKLLVAAIFISFAVSGCCGNSHPSSRDNYGMMSGCHRSADGFTFDNDHYEGDPAVGFSKLSCANAKNNWEHIPYTATTGERDPKTGLLP